MVILVGLLVNGVDMLIDFVKFYFECGLLVDLLFWLSGIFFIGVEINDFWYCFVGNCEEFNVLFK